METTKETGTAETATQQLHNQLFDKCFKFLMQRLSPKPLIMSINALFDEHYPLDSKVSRLDKEFITSGLSKILTDSLILVDLKPYLTEVQIQNDSEMVIRMVEYGLASSRFFSVVIDDILTAYFPREVVIYLQSNANTPTVERMRLVFPDGSEHMFTIPTLRLSDLTLEELKAKGLFILLPFQVLNLRKAVVAAKTSERKAELALELKRLIDELLVFFEQQNQAGILTTADWNELVIVIDKLNEKLYKEEKEFKEVLNMFDDWDNDPRMIAARKIDAAIAQAEAKAEAKAAQDVAQAIAQAEAKAAQDVAQAEAKAQESEHRWQESEHRWQESERQRQTLELKLQAYERRDFR
jgi:hypothetical protein